MNEVLNAIITRRSCKICKPDMIPQQDIDQVIEAGLYAASGLNSQSPIIIAVTDKETRDLLSALNRRFDPRNRPDPFYGAPVVLVILAPRNIPTTGRWCLETLCWRRILWGWEAVGSIGRRRLLKNRKDRRF